MGGIKPKMQARMPIDWLIIYPHQDQYMIILGAAKIALFFQHKCRLPANSPTTVSIIPFLSEKTKTDLAFEYNG
jgi:hypothetical protein